MYRADDSLLEDDFVVTNQALSSAHNTNFPPFSASAGSRNSFNNVPAVRSLSSDGPVNARTSPTDTHHDLGQSYYEVLGAKAPLSPKNTASEDYSHISQSPYGNFEQSNVINKSYEPGFYDRLSFSKRSTLPLDADARDSRDSKPSSEYMNLPSNREDSTLYTNLADSVSHLSSNRADHQRPSQGAYVNLRQSDAESMHSDRNDLSEFV